MMHVIAARWLEQRKPAQNRIGTVINGFDLNHGNRCLIAGVVSRPFAERSLRLKIVNSYFPFDRDFRIDRNRQPRNWTVDNLQRRTENSSGIIVFIYPIGYVVRSNDEIDGMMT